MTDNATYNTQPFVKVNNNTSKKWFKQHALDWAVQEKPNLDEWYAWINQKLKPYDAVVGPNYTIWFFDEQKYTLWLLDQN